MPFSDVATSAVADTVKTIAALLVADTAGLRCRLRKLIVGFEDDTPGDASFYLAIKRVDDISAGGAGTAGSTITVANMPKSHSDLGDSPASGGVNYSVEPTTYGTNELYVGPMNSRGTLTEYWEPELAPVADRDQLLGLLMAPRAAALGRVGGSMIFEKF